MRSAALILALLVSAPSFAATVVLTWTNPTEREDGSPFEPALNRIYRGATCDDQQLIAQLPATNTYTDVAVREGAYCYSVETLDSVGRVSDKVSRTYVMAEGPWPKPPTNLVITVLP